jgi:hypothetical protein
VVPQLSDEAIFNGEHVNIVMEDFEDIATPCRSLNELCSWRKPAKECGLLVRYLPASLDAPHRVIVNGGEAKRKTVPKVRQEGRASTLTTAGDSDLAACAQ